MNLFSMELPVTALFTVAEATTGAVADGVNPFSGAVEYVATVLFGLAILHTFCVKQFAKLAHRYPEGSIQENLFHVLAETEVVFGIWAAVLVVIVGVLRLSIADAVKYV